MIKKYNNFIREKNDNDLPSYMDDNLDYDHGDQYDYDDISDSDSTDSNEEMENLTYWIRTLFSNSGINIEVDYDRLDISIYCDVNDRSSLKEIINILEVSKKLSKDILPQYTSRMSMYETKKGKKLIVFDFFYDDIGDELPF